MVSDRLTHIIFDIDGTLIDESAVLSAQAHAVGWKFGNTPEAMQCVIHSFFRVNDYAANLPEKEKFLCKNNIPWYMERMGIDLGIPVTSDEIVTLAKDWVGAFNAVSESPHVFDDVIPCLESLIKEGKILIAASGNTTSNRKMLLEKCGLDTYFKNIYAAQDVGYQKQDKRFWESVFNDLGVAPEYVAVVGNQVNDDIEHPHSLGAYTTLIRRPGLLSKEYNSRNISPDSSIESLSELFVHDTKTFPKIAFILQQVSEGTHMDYVYEMARSLKEEAHLPVTLLIEKGNRNKALDWIIVQRFHSAFLRSVENFVRMLILRLRGHTIFYIHYSFLSAITAGFITKIFGGTVYYWNAGMPWLYKRGWVEEHYQRFAYKLIDYLVTGAGALARGYSEYYHISINAVSVIPNWINLEEISHDALVRTRVRTELNIPEDAKILLFVHKLVSRKGAHLLPEIFRNVHVPNTYLLVAGDGSLKDDILDQCMRDGTSDRVRLLGQVNRIRVEELMQTADVFVMPSEEEGSPHALIEAMAYGLPLVAFDVGGVRETASPASSKFIYTYGEVTRMALGITTLLTDDSEYRAQQRAESEWVVRFGKKVIQNSFVELFYSSKN